MHGGARGSGAPVGNQNALKSGHFTRQKRAFRKLLSSRALAAAFKKRETA
jgi:hypothetical protein